MTVYKEGTKVQWDWGSGTATGKIETIYQKKVTREIKGVEVTRNASQDEAAYFIKQDNGDAVLKSHSEVKKA